MMKRLMLGAAMALALGTAQAAPVEIDVCADSGCSNPTRLWTNGGGNVDFSNGGDTVTWGNSLGQGRNTLVLNDLAEASGNFGESLLLGTMRYTNRPTTNNPTGVDLFLAFNVLAPSDGTGFLGYTFDGVLTSRTNPAADTLDFSSDSPVTRQWTSGGQAYLLTVWISPESLTLLENTAQTFNIYASVNKVPVPATLALLGLGCLGLAAMRRRVA